MVVGAGLALPYGKGEVRLQGRGLAILAFGTLLYPALQAGEKLDATVANMRFAKPLDEALIRRMLTTHEVAVTIEENAIGGLGAHVLTMASDEGLIDGVWQPIS